MAMQHIYWFILFDISVPTELGNEIIKRIDKKEYVRLVDKNIKDFYGNEILYKIISRRSFMIHTSIDCSFYIVIDAEKIEK